MLDPTGAVATCNATNFFIVRNDEVYTATGMYNLNGITSALVVEVARDAGIPARRQTRRSDPSPYPNQPPTIPPSTLQTRLATTSSVSRSSLM